jgi:N-ethylmaleimide reductase
MRLLEESKLSGLLLSSKIVMAPLTRKRSTKEHVPVPIMAEYYAQRSSAGLIIAEGSSPSPNGAGYANMPGLYNEEQKEAWIPITKAVHKKGGKIFLQVMHTGRVGHSNNLDHGAEVLGPSSIRQEGEISTYDNDKQPYTVPRAMTIDEIKTSIDEFRRCSELAIEAGFDGVEIHSAHGYLPNQFLNQSSNTRTDEYGGEIKNRIRFLLEVIKSSCSAIGSEKVALRISPFSYADTKENPSELFRVYNALIEELNSLDLAYLHLSHMGEPYPEKFKLWKELRSNYNGTLMLCGDFTKESAEKTLLDNEADLIAFGRDFIANPDLVERFKNEWPLAIRDRSNWYTLGNKGLTDYPFFKEFKNQ